MSICLPFLQLLFAEFRNSCYNEKRITLQVKGMHHMGKMIGREEPKSNDLFFTCSLIDYIARKTKNHRSDIVNALGKERLAKIYDLADIYHSDNLERVSDDFIQAAEISQGNFDNISIVKYAIPSHWDIGKVYKRLILGIARHKNIDVVDALYEAYNSFVSEKIEDFNSSFYYDAPQNILNAFIDGKLIEK